MAVVTSPSPRTISDHVKYPDLTPRDMQTQDSGRVAAVTIGEVAGPGPHPSVKQPGLAVSSQAVRAAPKEICPDCRIFAMIHLIHLLHELLCCSVINVDY